MEDEIDVTKLTSCPYDGCTKKFVGLFKHNIQVHIDSCKKKYEENEIKKKEESRKRARGIGFYFWKKKKVVGINHHVTPTTSIILSKDKSLEVALRRNGLRKVRSTF